ncbi:Probable formate transporter [Durusdinium trenchii]|uniref:Probable formate transporter n=1 Tax=Durusdinium trenchii TaxID=1381693 RepID=A0ABP0KES3_9DINO
MSVAFVAPQASLAKLEATSDYTRYQNRGKNAFVSGYDGSDASVNHALTSMAAMFVVVGGVRWRERRQRVTLRRAGGGPSTAVVGSPQETYQELVDKSEYLRDQHWTKTFHAGFMGGAYVGMAGLLSLVIGGNMASEFITQKAVFAALFPINLLLVLTTGGQLFTGNSATMAIGVYEKKCTTKDRICSAIGRSPILPTFSAAC